MIKFKNEDDNKQFICIQINNEHTKTTALSENLKLTYLSLKQANVIFDNSEILIEIDNGINYDFSLNELRRYIEKIEPSAEITHFCVNTDIPTQRYAG